MRKTRLVWHFIVVCVVEFLPYHYAWLRMWLGAEQPIVVALMAPLPTGDLFLAAGIIWFQSVADLCGIVITTPHATRRSRIHWISLMGVAFGALIPLVVYCATDDGAPLKGAWIGCEKITTALIVAFSMCVCVFRQSQSSRKDVTLSPYLLKRHTR